jgi:flagellar hook assembly protein FlgD
VWLKAASEVKAAIVDAEGRAVRALAVKGTAGVNRLEWDLRRDDGRDAPPGVYRVEVAAGARKAFGQIVVRPAGGM